MTDARGNYSGPVAARLPLLFAVTLLGACGL